MSNDAVVSLGAPARVSDPLTELLRTGARRLVEAAVSAEFEEYLSAFVQEQLPDGRQRVVRNGHLPERKILTGLGEGGVRVPSKLAWRSFAWFVSEPDHIMMLHRGADAGRALLSELMRG